MCDLVMIEQDVSMPFPTDGQQFVPLIELSPVLSPDGESLVNVTAALADSSFFVGNIPP